MFEHEADEGDDVEICERAGIALVVLDEASEADRPGEGALDHPGSRQQDEAALGLRQSDDLQCDAVLARSLSRPLPGVALIDIGEVDVIAGGGLDRLGELPDLGAVVGLGGRDVQRQEVAERVDSQVDLRAFLALGAIVFGPLAALGRRA